MTAAATDEEHFQRIPRYAQLLADPSFTITATPCRQPKASSEDSLLAETLSTDETVRAFISLYRVASDSVSPIPEVRNLLSLGPGLNGPSNVCHGGFIATAIDETMGLLLQLNKERDQALGRAATRSHSMTVFLKVKYIAPVNTPGVVCVSAMLDKTDGRKRFVKAMVDDEEGKLCATAEALFVEARAKL